MAFKTYQEIETKILVDLDLQDETIIGTGLASEMMGYCNDAIHEAESIILSLCEDYFLTYAFLSFVNGTSDYDLPVDIFIDKIRRILYNNGSTIYPVKRMRRSTMFQDIALTNLNPGTNFYRHILINSAASGKKIQFVPTPQETTANVCKIWYIRQANTIAALSDSVDIPEFHNFIEKYMKKICLEKEGNPGATIAAQAYEQEKSLMIQTLSNREPDTDDELEMDLSFYEEHN